MRKRLEGTVTLVTGGGRGIGKAIGKRFAAEGSSVMLTARTESQLAEAAAEIGGSGGIATYEVADVSAYEGAQRVVEVAYERYGKIDHLVNNAGVLFHVPMHSMTVEQWDEVLLTNLFAPFFLCKLTLQSMFERKRGCIVNIASRAARRGSANLAAYCASKSGLLGLTEALAEEAKPYGVRVNAICPNGVDTQMLRDVWPQADGANLMPPERIADVALFLCLPDSSGITGTAVDVFGMRVESD